MVWILIALGLYRCSIQLPDMEEAREQEIGTDPQEDTGQNVIQENIPETPFDENVRILIMNAGYHGIYHTELHLSLIHI